MLDVIGDLIDFSFYFSFFLGPFFLPILLRIETFFTERKSGPQIVTILWKAKKNWLPFGRIFSPNFDGQIPVRISIPLELVHVFKWKLHHRYQAENVLTLVHNANIAVGVNENFFKSFKSFKLSIISIYLD